MAAVVFGRIWIVFYWKWITILVVVPFEAIYAPSLLECQKQIAKNQSKHCQQTKLLAFGRRENEVQARKVPTQVGKNEKMKVARLVMRCPAYTEQNNVLYP